MVGERPHAAAMAFIRVFCVWVSVAGKRFRSGWPDYCVDGLVPLTLA